MFEGVFIIAEAGVNHNGKLELAKKLIDKAVYAGVDAVKFQTFITEYNICRNAPKAKYQIETTEKDESQFEMIKKLELSFSEHEELFHYCKEKGILYLSTPADNPSIDLLNSFGMEIFKIPSGEVTNMPYLKRVGSLMKKIILSTGMATMDEVRTAVKILLEAGTEKKGIVVLHCNTEYPTPMEDVNLKAMLAMRDELGVLVGYSDHTLGIEIPIAAVALGATVIEKHFTLDHNLPGPDHRASLEPDELKSMVACIRNIERAVGDGVKKPSPSEKKNIPIVRKSIVAKKTIKKGERFSEENLTIKRPGIGISPMEWEIIIGKYSDKNYQVDDLIE